MNENYLDEFEYTEEELEDLVIDEKDTHKYWGISKKWKYFADCYYSVSGFVAYDAYMKAYPTCVNVNSAHVSAHRLLHNDKLRPYLDYLEERHNKKMVLTAHKMVDMMEQMYTTSIDDVMDILFTQKPVVLNGQFLRDPETNEIIYEVSKSICIKDLKSLPKFMRLAVQEIKETREGFQVKLVEKNKLNELIGKWKNAFTEKHDVGGQLQVVFADDVPEPLEE